MENKVAHVVVLGGGFGGLAFCQEFYQPSARITLVDRQNHHLFQPLLYQVATSALSAPDIAQPIRSILVDKPNLTVLLDRVADFRLSENQVILEKNVLAYDYLVVALGGATSYFGHPEWEQFAPGLKSLDDALRIRREILFAFEKAENTQDEKERHRLLTIVVVGGGPTGLELAGAFAELRRYVLRRDFRRIDPTHARIVLIEASPAIVGSFSPELSASARRQLEELGVEIQTSTRVKSITRGRVETDKGTIEAENIVWAAGVCATTLTKKLGVELDKGGRIKVNHDLSLPGFPNVFAIGDLALILQENGHPVPGVSPAAMQMGRHVAGIIQGEITGIGSGHAERPPFHYWDKGTMATIGRSAAIAKIGKVEFSGFLAWFAWLFVHLLFLVGFRNKVAVLFHWAYSYFTFKRGARIITGLPTESTPQVNQTSKS